MKQRMSRQEAGRAVRLERGSLGSGLRNSHSLECCFTLAEPDRCSVGRRKLGEERAGIIQQPLARRTCTPSPNLVPNFNSEL
jgi:hypothetical protein